MRIFAYHHGSNGISHYRVWQPMKYIAHVEGMEVNRLPDITERIHIPNTGVSNVPGIGSHESIAVENDLIFTTSCPSIQDTSRLVAQMHMKPVVIDIDDDIFHIDVNNKGAKAWAEVNDGAVEEVPGSELENPSLQEKAKRIGATVMEREGKFYLVKVGQDPVVNVLDQIQRAAGVTVSTERLRDLYYAYNPNIEVIPNAVDFDIWPANKRKDDGLIRLGLFGSNSHYGDWKEIAETLARILKEYPQVRLCINPWITAKGEQGKVAAELTSKRYQFPDFLESLGLIDNPQTEIYEPCEIQDWQAWLSDKGIDIGLAPLKDTLFNQGKSNLKYLEFSALRVPGVYEKLRPYSECVEHGSTGFLASHPADWYSCIKRLIEDDGLRRSMGNRAWMDVRNRYDQSKVVQKLAEFLRKTAADFDPNRAEEKSFIKDRAPRPVLALN